ncbi:MAG: Ppx/GppA family phosphatase [Acidobacteria bacterium]|nr:Ppx/GppA family phosphatase [Acidobacteriota bacterium]
MKSSPAPALQDAAGEVTFPLLVAAVDAGSNAIRFVVAEFASTRAYTVLEQERAPVRLGHGVFLNGRLSESAMDEAVSAFARFAGRMKELEVSCYRAVATSAVREARNGELLLSRVREEAGLELEAISGSDEARLVHLAVRSVVPLAGKEWILADLGGGSVEVSLVDDAGILWCESHTMGSVRLLEELSGAAEEPGRFRRLLEEYTSTLRLPSAAQYVQPAGFIATGGNIEALARLAGVNEAPGRAAVLPLDMLRTVIGTLARLSFRQRVEELGLREDRADVILPAAMVYERLAELAGAKEILVPFVGIKEGVLLDAAEALTTRAAREDRQMHELRTACLALGRRYMFDESHALQVCRLALSLYDQLAAVHGMGEEERRILAAAALLHDIGAYISYKKHHKHSQYLIAHSELPGLPPHGIDLVANVARYHRKGEPADHHQEFTVLNAEDQERVTKLAAILRLADALDREHSEHVTEVRAEVDRDTLHLWLQGEGDLLLEKWALERKSQLFRKAFRLSVKVRNGVRSG